MPFDYLYFESINIYCLHMAWVTFGLELWVKDEWDLNFAFKYSNRQWTKDTIMQGIANLRTQ